MGPVERHYCTHIHSIIIDQETPLALAWGSDYNAVIAVQLES